MADEIKIEMSAEEWGQVMMILQSGVYRVVAPLLQKMNNQVVEHVQAQTQRLRVVPPPEAPLPPEAADG